MASSAFSTSTRLFGAAPTNGHDATSSSSAPTPVAPAAASMNLSGVIGFNGTVPHGLLLHPNDRHLLYPLGSTIVVRDLVDNTQTFLHKGGHDRAVSCMALSATGKYLASGQETHMGFEAVVIVWDLETFEVKHRLSLHKGKVQDVAFSPSEKYLATLGGRDDNKLVLWDVESGTAICGSPAANETCSTVRFLNHTDGVLVSGGHSNLRVWNFDSESRKLRPTDCQLGQLKRIIHSIVVDENDEYMYCGTASGDLLQVSLSSKLFRHAGPPKRGFQLGITCVMRTKRGNYIVGTGDGTVALMKKDGLTVARKTNVNGAVTSLVLNAAGDHFFVGTSECNQYLIHAQSFESELRNTCHNGPVSDVAFPQGYSELFATCGGSDIRVWNASTRNELLRIQVPNLSCLCVCFAPDGKSIISGWNDGKIRAFKPQSGKLAYSINDAHLNGVTAIATTSDGRMIVSGGEGGQVRVWAIERNVQTMVASMKEHKGRINSIRINGDDSECVTASNDGSCIIWSLQRFVRVSALFASTQFRSVVYHPDQSQLLTAGSDRKLTYWDIVDANPIRILDASSSAGAGSHHESLQALAITSDGLQFASGGGEKVVKVWAYDEGVCGAKGVGHSGSITGLAIAPNQETIVSIGDEGAIFIWERPRFRVEEDGNIVHGEDPIPTNGGYDDEAALSESMRSQQLGSTNAAAANGASARPSGRTQSSAALGASSRRSQQPSSRR